MFSLSEEQEHFLRFQLRDDLDRLLMLNHRRTHDIGIQTPLDICKKYINQRHLSPGLEMSLYTINNNVNII